MPGTTYRGIEHTEEVIIEAFGLGIMSLDDFEEIDVDGFVIWWIISPKS